MGPRGLGPKTIKLLNQKNHEIQFFQHGKDVHRGSAQVALNDSSRSLIWNFWEQIMFSGKCENTSHFLKYVHTII